MTIITEIRSNGSKWYGQAPDSIETLIEVLANYPLDRIFEHYGNFKETNPKWGRNGKAPSPYPGSEGIVVFSGNFLNLSHVFNIHTNDPEVINKLTRAIAANKRRPDYQSQPKPTYPACICRKCDKPSLAPMRLNP